MYVDKPGHGHIPLRLPLVLHLQTTRDSYSTRGRAADAQGLAFQLFIAFFAAVCFLACSGLWLFVLSFLSFLMSLDDFRFGASVGVTWITPVLGLSTEYSSL